MGFLIQFSLHDYPHQNEKLTDDIEYQVKLVAVVTPREKRAPGNKLCENAANRPDIDGLLMF